MSSVQAPSLLTNRQEVDVSPILDTVFVGPDGRGGGRERAEKERIEHEIQ